MRLHIKANGKIRSFDVSVFRDEEEKRLYFLIQIAEMGSILVEKVSATREWRPLCGNPFPSELQIAIFAKRDRTSVERLLDDEKPFGLLNEYFPGYEID